MTAHIPDTLMKSGGSN